MGFCGILMGWGCLISQLLGICVSHQQTCHICLEMRPPELGDVKHNGTSIPTPKNSVSKILWEHLYFCWMDCYGSVLWFWFGIDDAITRCTWCTWDLLMGFHGSFDGISQVSVGFSWILWHIMGGHGYAGNFKRETYCDCFIV